MERYGTTWLVRHGTVRSDKVRQGGAGKAGDDGFGDVMSGEAWQAQQGTEGQCGDMHGRYSQEMHGKALFGKAWQMWD